MTERVLHVVNGDEYGGSERVQELLAAGLPTHGFEVGFACVKPGAFALARRDGPWPMHSIRMRSRGDLAIVRTLVAILRRGGYAMVHTHTPRAAVVGRPAAALGGVPMVHHVHGSTITVWPGRLRNYVTTAAERLSLVRVGAVIVCRPLSAARSGGSGSRPAASTSPQTASLDRPPLLGGPRPRATGRWA